MYLLGVTTEPTTVGFTEILADHQGELSTQGHTPPSPEPWRSGMELSKLQSWGASFPIH